VVRADVLVLDAVRDEHAGLDLVEVLEVVADRPEVAVVAVLVAVAVPLYDLEVRPEGIVLLVTTALAATCGLAAVGTLYGGLAAGARGRETLLPLLLLPVVAPALIGATRAIEPALGADLKVSEGWPWMGLVALFTVLFGIAGTVAFGPLIEDEESA